MATVLSFSTEEDAKKAFQLIQMIWVDRQTNPKELRIARTGVVLRVGEVSTEKVMV